ncbi:DKNYY domain-containing protein [bacterium]|nr:DKNYY domain-containing protein [bacterium]
MKNKSITMVILILSFFSCSKKEKVETNYLIRDQTVYFQIDKDQRKLRGKLRPIEEADAATFKVIPSTLDYGSDKTSVFMDFQLIEDADPESFKLLEKNQFATDKDHVYYYGLKMKGADPKTFVIVNDHYSSDANHIFHNHFQIEGADLESFEILRNDRYAKDKNHFYDGALQLDPSDTETRSLIESLQRS